MSEFAEEIKKVLTKAYWDYLGESGLEHKPYDPCMPFGDSNE